MRKSCKGITTWISHNRAKKELIKLIKYSRIHNVVSKKPHRPSTFAAATGSILFAARDYFCNCRCTRCSRYRTGVDGSPR